MIQFKKPLSSGPHSWSLEELRENQETLPSKVKERFPLLISSLPLPLSLFPCCFTLMRDSGGGESIPNVGWEERRLDEKWRRRENDSPVETKVGLVTFRGLDILNTEVSTLLKDPCSSLLLGTCDTGRQSQSILSALCCFLLRSSSLKEVRVQEGEIKKISLVRQATEFQPLAGARSCFYQLGVGHRSRGAIK